MARLWQTLGTLGAVSSETSFALGPEAKIASVTAGKTVLLCDDQPMIHETLREYIEAEGYSCVSAYDGAEALKMFSAEHPDVVLLDLMLPKVDGLEVCRTIRMDSTVPIIMLTAKGEEIDRILGLELGADDYIVKPFSPREVVARIKVILRRVSGPPQRDDDVLKFPGLEVNLDSYEVKSDGKVIPFTAKEVRLLFELCSTPGRVLSREQLLSSVWGYDYYGDTRVVDSQIKRIRQKLPNSDNWSIKAVYGVGYKFELQPNG